MGCAMSVADKLQRLNRRDAVRELLRDRGESLVVTGLGSPSYDVFAAGDHDNNMYLWGAMGGASLVGLGLALAQPRRPVVVITGDGEQLMGLGGLATISVKKPRNFTLVVLDNGRFGETGGQKSHTALDVDLHRVAAAMGFALAVELREISEIPDYRMELTKLTGGPRYVSLRIAPDTPPRALPARDGFDLEAGTGVGGRKHRGSQAVRACVRFNSRFR
jgi:thiamine pyrophosphate-dependent acetolactate synthase large subunit-like protein